MRRRATAEPGATPGEGRYLFGIHAVSAALSQGGASVAQLWRRRGRADRRLVDLIGLAEQHGIPVHECDGEVLDRLAAGGSHQGVVAELASATREVGEEALDGLIEAAGPQPLLLVLDGVQDPHNLGACLRSADGAGVCAVIAPRDRACTLTATVRKVACGAAESVPFVRVTNLARTLRHLKAQGIWLVGMAGEAQQSLYQTELTGPLALVMGGEERGMRRLTRDECDYLVHLPMHGQVESLNVSVATAVALYEAVRQRACAG